ncbi:preprotein translocase subunit SecG [uncultured Flavobacterium sp.]|uniref:preprotein translocase subunit SecG n=1 Tax=uncultured Flavobacterium sp. TaxID=165435 RepID=UPI0030CA3EFB
MYRIFNSNYIVCFLLILAIMVQNPKGGGLSSSFGGTQQIGGVQKTTDFLDKSTWYLGIALIVLIFLSTLSFDNGGVNGSKIIDESEINIPSATVPSTNTAAPTTANDSTK